MLQLFKTQKGSDAWRVSLASAHQSILQNACTTARRFAELGKPEKHEKHLAPYIHQIQAAYNGLLSSIHANLNTTATLYMGKIDAQISGENKKQLQKDIRKLEESKRQDKLDGSTSSHTPIKVKLLVALLITGLLHLGETFFNISAFQVFGDMWLASAALAFALSIALFCWSHAVPVFVKRAEDKWGVGNKNIMNLINFFRYT